MSSGGCDVPVRQRASASQCCNSNTSLSLCDCLFVYLGLPSDPGLPPITDLANKPPTRPIVRGEPMGTRKRGYGIRAPYRRTRLWWNLAPVCVVFEMGFHSGNRPILVGFFHILSKNLKATLLPTDFPSRRLFFKGFCGEYPIACSLLNQYFFSIINPIFGFFVLSNNLIQKMKIRTFLFFIICKGVSQNNWIWPIFCTNINNVFNLC